MAQRLKKRNKSGDKILIYEEPNVYKGLYIYLYIHETNMRNPMLVKNKKSTAKQNGDDGDKSDSDNDDESKIVRENNHVYFYSEVSRESIFKLNVLLREAARFVHTTCFDLNIKNIPVYIHINSLGGSLYDAYSTVDTIKNLRVPVYSIIEGSTASAGTLISVICEKRFIRPNAHMLIHQLSGGCWGKMGEIEDEFKNLQDLMKKIKQVYIDNASMPRKELNELLKHDLWLDSDKSLKYGLVDELWNN